VHVCIPLEFTGHSVHTNFRINDETAVKTSTLGWLSYARGNWRVTEQQSGRRRRRTGSSSSSLPIGGLANASVQLITHVWVNQPHTK